MGHHLYLHGEGNGNPLQCSCLENPRDGGAWWAAILWGRTESGTAEATYPLEEGMATHSSILPWINPMDRGAWWAISHLGQSSP